jgi:hypothetical protein
MSYKIPSDDIYIYTKKENDAGDKTSFRHLYVDRLYMHKDKSSVERYQIGTDDKSSGTDLLIWLDHLKMVAILFQSLNHVHRFGIDNFVVELILVNHVLTIRHIYDEQMLNYFLGVHWNHLHP